MLTTDIQGHYPQPPQDDLVKFMELFLKGGICRQMSEVLASRTIENGGDFGKLERMSAMCKGGGWCSAPTDYGGSVGSAARVSIL